MHLWLALTLLFPSVIHAQDAPSPVLNILKENCAHDIERLCSETAEHPSILACLAKNKESLSITCKEGVQRIAQASQQAQSRGGSALGAFGGMNAFSPPVPLLVLESRVVPGEDSTRLSEHKANFSLPVYRTQSETVSFSAAYGNLGFQDQVILDSGLLVPTTLQRAEIGAQYFRQSPERRSWSLRGSIGYAGDAVFEKDMTFSVNGMYSYPGSEKSMWGFTFFFANNSPIGNFVPIPGFLYIYRTENFTGLFGLPIASIQWTPAYPWSLSFSIFGPTIMTEAAYGSINKLQMFTGAQWTQQLYMLEKRVNDDDRLVLEEKKVFVGLRTPLMEKINGELQVGHGFDRALYFGEGLFNKDGGERDLDDSIYFNVVVRMIL